MRIVLDTNVLIAAFITTGVCTALLEHCVRSHELVTSEFILDEFRDKLISKFDYTVTEVQEALELLRLAMQVVLPATLENPVSRDPDDDMVLSTAILASAACIISGDRDLLILGNYRGVDIIAPAQFAEYEEGKAEPL